MFEVISAYSRKEALTDGILIDVSQIAKEAGFKYPVAVTTGVESLISQAVANTKYCNDYNGVLWDILWICSMNARKSNNREFMFQVIITGLGRKKYHTFKAVCGPGDDLEPVITIMLENED